MRTVATILTLAGLSSCFVVFRNDYPTEDPAQIVVDAQYDGTCFYSKPDPKFNLNEYLGTWYQVAGTPFGPTLGARCVAANYALKENGNVQVINTATIAGAPTSIEGEASPAPKEYGDAGVFKVEFPSTPPAECAGPNYIVQAYGGDYAIVQTQNWNTLYVLSREREPGTEKIDEWIAQAVALGSNTTEVQKFDQAGC